MNFSSASCFIKENSLSFLALIFLLVILCLIFGRLQYFLQVFDLYGVGLRQAFSTPNLLTELNLKVITTHKNAMTSGY